ncbi:MAG: TolC family protein [Alphaproteobacteria bacterium]|nr:TolC family protein [Alphaproteobacteria bacterium]
MPQSPRSSSLLFAAFLFSATLALAVVFTGPFALAQEKAAQASLSPAELLELIEANGGYAFAAAAADLDAAHARLDGARANLFPRLTGTVMGKRLEAKKTIETRDSEVESSLELVQPIYDFGQTYSRVRAARSNIAAAGEKLRIARHTVLMEGLAVFFDLHVSELRMHSLNQDHASAYVHWERANERFKLGQADPVTVSEELARVEKTRLLYHRERSRNSSLRLRLEDLTGKPFSGELIDSPKPPAKKPTEVDTEKLFAFAETRNPEIKALARRAEALSFQRDGTGNRPRIEAFGTVGQSTREHRSREDWAVGARMTVPFFDGGLKSAEHARLDAEYRKVRAEHEIRRRDLRRQLREAVLLRNDSWQQVIAARAALDFLGRRLAKRQRLYEQERVADLGRAMIEFSGGESDVVRAAGTYYLASARLAVLLGENPSGGLAENFLERLLGEKIGTKDEQLSPKEGTGFGQDDLPKIER